MHFCFNVLVVFQLAFLEISSAFELLVLTVATENNDALERLLRSGKNNGYNVQVIGLHGSWMSVNGSSSSSGGQNIRSLKETLESLSNSDQIVLFTSAYDTVFLNEPEKLLEKYRKIGSEIVFGADDVCWPDDGLKENYPRVQNGGKRFLNAGVFIGPASSLYRLLSKTEIKDDDDDQLFYTRLFLDPAIRKEFDIGLDSQSSIVYNLNHELNDLEIKFTDDTSYLYNAETKTSPVIVHGHGPTKPQLNSLSNYLDYSWTESRGCQQCAENNIDVSDPEKLPVIQLSLMIAAPTPFLDIFLERIALLSYPKRLIHLTAYVSKSAEFQQALVDSFKRSYGDQYRTVMWFDSGDTDNEGASYDKAFAHSLAIEDCQFVFIVNSTVQLTASDTIENLVQMNRSILTPLVSRRGKLWSNFWGAISDNGFYKRSEDYVDIVEGNRKGIWNVPFIRDAYLLSRRSIRHLAVNKFTGSDVEMSIAKIARDENIFMMVDNRKEYGYLVLADNYDTTHVHNDLWQIFDNPMDWEELYVNTGYHEMADPNTKLQDFKQPCPDVFWYPLVSEKFAQHLLDEVIAANVWSDGSNHDPRLEGGYENVPTRDTHMRQIGWEDAWLHFLIKYVYPIQTKLFEGYWDKPWARMNFIVRYRPDEQPSLRAHHDASSFTLNIALNRPGIDFEGGGTLFNRYNCSVVNGKVGWTAMFPGRITHLHEGLETTKGTRYIFVTFVNP